MANVINSIYLMILSLGLGFQPQKDTNAVAVVSRVESSLESQIRKKVESLSANDKKKALGFLSLQVDSSIEDKLIKYQNKQDFSKTELSEPLMRSLLLKMAHGLPSHNAQKAVFVILMAVGTASSSDIRRAGSVNIQSHLAYFEQEEITVVPYEKSWGIKTKRGCFWSAEALEMFIK